MTAITTPHRTTTIPAAHGMTTRATARTIGTVIPLSHGRTAQITNGPHLNGIRATGNHLTTTAAQIGHLRIGTATGTHHTTMEAQTINGSPHNGTGQTINGSNPLGMAHHTGTTGHHLLIGAHLTISHLGTTLCTESALCIERPFYDLQRML